MAQNIQPENQMRFMPAHADFFAELMADSDSENEFEGFSEAEEEIEPLDINFDPFAWTEGEPERDPFLFTGSPGLNVPLVDNPSVLDFFQLFFKEEDFSDISINTNLYAEQYLATNHARLAPNSRFLKWVDTTPREIKVFLGMIIAMGLVTQLELSEYFTEDPVTATPFFPACMARNRFQLLLSFFHLCDNLEQVPRGDPGYNPLNKLGDIYNRILSRFASCYTPHQQLSFDEGMIPWKGNLAFRVYNPDKPIKYGVKAYMLCDAVNGFCKKFKLYTGKSANGPSPAGATYDLVMDNLRGLFGQGYILYCDNYYTSPHLFWDLWHLGVGATGTVRKNRVGVPQEVKDKKLAQKGDTFVMKNGPMSAVKYLDSKYVLLVSTVERADIISTGKRDPKTGQDVKRPLLVVKYDKFMGGVDRCDQMIAYNSSLGTLKWWKKVFFHVFSLAILNAYIVYKEVTNDRVPMVQRVFRKKIVSALVSSAGLPTTQSTGRPRTQNLDRLNGRHFIGQNRQPDGTKCRPKMCVVCNPAERQMLPSGIKRKCPGKETSYKCKDCNVALCIEPCYELYHTKQDYILAYKRFKRGSLAVEE